MTAKVDRFESSIWKISAVAVLGSFLSQLDATIVNVSLSNLAGQLRTGLSTIHWVTSGYLLALALMLPLNGWLVDRIGAKALYIWCFSAFTLSSALCGLAWSAESLIGFRVLQGMSGGLLAPMAQLMMARAAGNRMASVLSLAAMPILLAPLLGPVIAGVILQYASWRWLFLVNLPVGILAVALAFLFLPSDRGETHPRQLDAVGLALLSPGLVLFVYGADRIRDPVGMAALGASALLLYGYSRWAARRREAALVDLRLLREKVFAASVTTQFLTNGISFAGQMLIPYFLTRVGGRSPSATGLLLMPLGLGMMCGYPLVGTLVKRFGNRATSVGGAALALLATAPLIYLAGQGLDVRVLSAALFARGLGLSWVGVPSISAAYSSVRREDLPMAATALNIVMRLGGPTLTTVCATFLGWRLGLGAAPGAFAAAFVLLCGFHAGLIAAAFRLPRWVEAPTEPAPTLVSADHAPVS